MRLGLAVKQTITAGLVGLLVSGCAKDLSPDSYTAGQAGEVSQTYKGKILNVRQVTVEGSDSLGGNIAGAGIGAVGGGVLGNMIGQGKGRILSTAAGAALGGIGGAYAEKKLKQQKALEYIVKLDNGQTITLVQGVSPAFSVGQRVFVHVSGNGRSRITADTSAAL
ncbi:MAG: glycine zipper 2TM domain-containing protein [Holosporales bacterium]|jgi:outer membrane lipoprotein SlyB|nr:glycine zipper 2TM domain-containing protein [Holosporales bacterium]